MKVFCYFNLHRKCWSIKALEGSQLGRVVAHALQVNISNATFKVSESGRQRVLREKRKNVHAGVVGQWDGQCNADAPAWLGEGMPVTYDPYLYSSFVVKATGAAIYQCTDVHLNKGALVYVYTYMGRPAATQAIT
jgi:hypothetical protein